MDTKYPPVPKRPLTSYNLFSILERQYILQVNKKTSSDSESNTATRQDDEPYGAERPQRYRDLVLPRDWYVVGMNRTKRKDHKSHGLISFNVLSKTLSFRWMVADDEVKAYCKFIAGEELKEYRRKQEEYKKTYGIEAFESQKKVYKKQKSNEDDPSIKLDTFKSVDEIGGKKSKNDKKSQDKKSQDKQFQVAQWPQLLKSRTIKQNDKDATAMSAYYHNHQAFSTAQGTTINQLVGAFPSAHGFAGAFFPTEEGANAEQQAIQSRIEFYNLDQRMHTNMLDANNIYTSMATRTNSADISNINVSGNSYTPLANADLLAELPVRTVDRFNSVDFSASYPSTASRNSYTPLAAVHEGAIPRDTFREANVFEDLPGHAARRSNSVDANTTYSSTTTRNNVHAPLAAIHDDSVARDAFRARAYSLADLPGRTAGHSDAVDALAASGNSRILLAAVQGGTSGNSPNNTSSGGHLFSSGQNDLLCQPCSPNDFLEGGGGNQAMMGLIGGMPLPLGQTKTFCDSRSESSLSGELLSSEEVSKAFDSDSENDEAS